MAMIRRSTSAAKSRSRGRSWTASSTSLMACIVAAGRWPAQRKLSAFPVSWIPDASSSRTVLGALTGARVLLGVTGGRDESVTSTMTVNFLRPFAPGPVLAEALLLKRGKRMVFGEVLLRAEASEEVSAHVTATWAVIGPTAPA